MASRLKLHEELCELLGNRNVYFNPPSSLTLKYPCIVYNRTKPDIKRANDQIYSKTNCYELTVITKNPDDDTYERIMEHFKYADYDRSFSHNNLCHDALRIYY